MDKETDVSSLPTTPQLLCSYISIRLGQSGTIASASPTNLSWELKATVHTCGFHGFPKSTFHSHWLYLSPFHCFKPVIYKGDCRGVYLLASLLQQSARLSKTSQREALPAWGHREDISMITSCHILGWWASPFFMTVVKHLRQAPSKEMRFIWPCSFGDARLHGHIWRQPPWLQSLRVTETIPWHETKNHCKCCDSFVGAPF